MFTAPGSTTWPPRQLSRVVAERLAGNWSKLLVNGLLLIGLVEVPLGVLALADPDDTLAALITVGGIWAVVVGISRIVMAFELRRLPDRVDEWWTRGDKDTRSNDTAGRTPAQTAA